MLMQFVGLIVAFVLTIGAFAFVIFRFCHPHHRIIALGLYTFSWVALVYSIWSYRDYVFMQSEGVRDLIVGYVPYLAWLGISFFFLVVLWFFRSRLSSEIAEMKAQDFEKAASDDAVLLEYLDRFVEEHTTRFENSILTDQGREEFSAQERRAVRALWKAVFDGLVEIDLIRNRYEDFYCFGRNRREDHIASFLIYYNCVLVQQHYIHRVQEVVKDNESLLKNINDDDQVIGLQEHSYSLSLSKSIAATEILQINLGRAYCEILDEEINAHPLYIRSCEILRYIDDHIKTYAIEIVKNPLKRFERSATTTFFPWQKKIAYGMSLIRVTDRPFLITVDYIKDHRSSLEPGDVLLQRREWFATNVGIPGYWTHSALYIGSMDEIDTYFSQLPEFADRLPSEHIAKEYPAVYEQLSGKDPEGFTPRVLEVKSPGVIVSSFEHSTSCDALGVLRPMLTPQEKWQMITQAMGYYGLPYDYNFDFSTDGSLVCSELIYKALEGISAVTLEPTMTNGRLLFTPNQFVEKFDKEYREGEQSFEFVLFWDGDEKTGTVEQREVDDFLGSWKRPKWHVLEQYLKE